MMLARQRSSGWKITRKGAAAAGRIGGEPGHAARGFRWAGRRRAGLRPSGRRGRAAGNPVGRRHRRCERRAGRARSRRPDPAVGRQGENGRVSRSEGPW